MWCCSAHYTTESRRGTRTSIRQNSLLSSFPVRSELIVLHHAVPGKRIRRTLYSSESGVGIRSYQTSDRLLVFAAVKKMAPSSREATRPEVPDERPFSLLSPRGPEIPGACILFWCLLVSANVPRTRLCSSLFVLQHSTCDPEVDAACATNEVVQFFVYCKKFTFQQHQRGFELSDFYLKKLKKHEGYTQKNKNKRKTQNSKLRNKK